MDKESYEELKEVISNGELYEYFGNEQDTFWLGVRYGKASVEFEEENDEK